MERRLVAADCFRRGARWCVVLLACLCAREATAAGFDLVIYGGTPAAVIAAVQATRMGKSVVIVCPETHLGGVASSGLGFTDTGNKAVIGGLSRDFYQRVWGHYDSAVAWRWQAKQDYGNRGQGTPAIDGAQRTMWIFEPHVAEQIFEDYVREYHIPVHRNEWLDRAGGVKKAGERLTSITMLGGRTYEGRMFIDATYEGDLMAAAGVTYRVGREANAEYGETWNGVQTGVLHHRHHFGAVAQPVSPYVIPGDATSGVVSRVSTAAPGTRGEADTRVQAYCYRLCLTDVPANRLPFPKPEHYDPAQYTLLLRVFEAGWRETFDKFDAIPNHKTDTNNHGPFSTDNIGMNYEYPEASYERRREILQEHETYQKGWLYFIANDPRVPTDVQAAMQRWGLAKDEFTDNGGWPHQIYVREARRMVGAYVMTENDLVGKRPTPDSVGMGSYGIDSHNIQRYITPEGAVQNEGDIGVELKAPYTIAYGAIVPKRGQAGNLLVPVCASSTHIAFGSIRMEPVFMILGQSAATAAVMAIDRGIAVQDVPYAALRARLLADGQVLEYSATPVIPVGTATAKWPHESTPWAAGLFLGSGIRGSGRVNECCATYGSELGHPTSVGAGVRVSYTLPHRFGMDLSAAWEPQFPDYRAYFQSDVPGPVPGYRFYRADNEVQAYSAEGRLQRQVAGAGRTTLHLSVGGGWVYERRLSHLRNITVRPTLVATPETEFDYRSSAWRPVTTAALTVRRPFRESPHEWFAEVGLRHRFGSEGDRSDLDLGHTAAVVRIGVLRRF
jgi:hypothetical protein